MKKAWFALILAASIGASDHAGATGRGHFRGHRSHFDIGFYFGPPVGYRYYRHYGYPYYPYPYPYSYYAYPPAVVTVPTQPPVYIEKAPKRESPEGYWYYCDDPSGYYPYVKECRGEWQPVPAEPPAER